MKPQRVVLTRAAWGGLRVLPSHIGITLNKGAESVNLFWCAQGVAPILPVDVGIAALTVGTDLAFHHMGRAKTRVLFGSLVAPSNCVGDIGFPDGGLVDSLEEPRLGVDTAVAVAVRAASIVATGAVVATGTDTGIVGVGTVVVAHTARAARPAPTSVATAGTVVLLGAPVFGAGTFK